MAARRKTGWRKRLPLPHPARSQKEHSHLAERRCGRYRESIRELAAAGRPIREFAEDEGVRLPLPSRRGCPQRLTGFARFTLVAGVVMARLRSGENGAGVRA